jgi:hypothetical protein
LQARWTVAIALPCEESITCINVNSAVQKLKNKRVRVKKSISIEIRPKNNEK